MIEKERLFIEKTKRQLPALWECGGGMTNSGHSQIIAGFDGRKKTPIYIRTKGPRALENHALFIIENSDIVITVDRVRDDYSIWVKKIIEIDVEKNEAMVVNEYHYYNGEWDHEPIELYKAAIDAAVEKSNCYHCRGPHYAIF